MKRLLLSAVACLLLSVNAKAQDPITGMPPFGSLQDGGFDAVNRQNLNANFAIPIVSSVGRGMPLQFAVVYDSLVWVRSGNTWTSVIDDTGTAIWGWKLEKVAGTVKYSKTRVMCEEFPYFLYSNYRYVEPSGTVHFFDITWDSDDSGLCHGSDAYGAYATDGSGFYMSPSFASATVRSPSRITFASTGRVTDTNGNFISSSVSGNVTTWKDTDGRDALKIDKSVANVIYYKFLDVSGNYQTITLNRQTFNIKTNFACSGVTEITTTASLPTSVTLPNGKSYSFTYEPTPGFSGYYTGRLKRVTLPSGGYVEYQYPTTGNKGIVCADGTVSSLTRVVNDGTTSTTWQYSRAQSGTNWITTVTAPQLPYDAAANASTFTFNSIKQEISQSWYQGASTLLRTINTTWASNKTPASRTTILENNQQSKVETDYDAIGNLLERREYDWGTGAPASSVTRKVSATYLATSAGSARPTQTLVKDGSGTIKSRTDIAYDEPAYLNSSCPTGVPQHDDTNFSCSYLTRGSPTTVTTYKDAATPGGSIARHTYYDVFGNVTLADLSCCQQKVWNYSATTQYAFPDSIVSGPAGTQLTTSATYNAYTGQVATSTDENGKVTTYTYSDPGHLNRLTDIQRPDSQHVTYAYDDILRTVTVTSPINASNSVRQISFADGLGRPIKQQKKDGSGTSYSIVETQYDSVGRVYKTSNPHNSTASNWTESRFDGIGRSTVTIPPGGSATSNNTSYAYSGNTVTATDPSGKQRKSQSDALGRVTTVFEPDPSAGNTLTLQTSSTYTVFDSILQVTQGAQTRTYSYDDLGRVLTAKIPETNQVQWSYVYNDFNLVTQRTDARGVITNCSYDGLNRPYQVSYNVGSTGVPATPTVTLTYGTNPAQNNNGRVITITDGVGSESYSYDVMGRTTRVDKVINGTSYTTQYGFNYASEVTSHTYPSGRVVQPSYDAIGRLCAVGVSGATCTTGTNYASSFAYNPAGQVTGFNYGNGVVAAYTYTSDRQLLNTLSHTKGASTLLSLTYGYTAPNGGNNGQVTSITDNVESGRTVNYEFDALYRLTKATTTGSTPYPKWGLSWAYDRYGNRLTQSISSGCVAPMVCPTNSVTVSTTTNRITGSPYAYDANGNMTNDGANTLVYDADNRLVNSVNGSNSGTYTYDGNGVRVKKVSGSTTTVSIFSGGQVIAEYQNGAAPSAPTAEYINSGGQKIALIQGSTVTYYHNDHLSLRIRSNTTGAIVDQSGTFPYGETWFSPSGAPWMFTTYYRDQESGNDYAMARYHVNRLGRFNSPDPVAGSLGNPQSLNRFAYVTNDPVNLVDPSGRLPWSRGYLHPPPNNPFSNWDIFDLIFRWEMGFERLSVRIDAGGFALWSQFAFAELVGGGGAAQDPQHEVKSDCFAQLKYRGVDDWRAKLRGATHAFWYVQDSTGSQYTISAGPTNPNGSGYLNVWVNEGTTGQLPNDKHTAKTAWNSGLSSDNCEKVDKLLQAAWDWPNFPNDFGDEVVYSWKGPNSNSAANYLGQASGLSPKAPPGSFGWNVPVPVTH